jgi:hypothetical protein
VDPSRKTSTISEYSSAALRLSDAIVQWLCLARCASLTSCGYQGRYFTFFSVDLRMSARLVRCADGLYAESLLDLQKPPMFAGWDSGRPAIALMGADIVPLCFDDRSRSSDSGRQTKCRGRPQNVPYSYIQSVPATIVGPPPAHRDA